MKKIIALIFYGAALGALLVSVVTNDTYILGLAIFNLLLAMNFERNAKEADRSEDE